MALNGCAYFCKILIRPAPPGGMMCFSWRNCDPIRLSHRPAPLPKPRAETLRGMVYGAVSCKNSSTAPFFSWQSRWKGTRISSRIPPSIHSMMCPKQAHL